MDTKAFAECMKRNMDKQGITTEALSEMTDITVEKLEECLSGDYKPTYKELTAISHAIKVGPLILMKGGGLWHSLVIDENGHRVSRWDEY